MKKIDPNYKPSTEFTSFPDGETTVDSFEWFSLDDNKNPILKMRKDGSLVGMLRFKNGDTQGPPMSVTLGEMSLLVKMFGKDPRDLPPRPHPSEAGKITEYMKRTQNLCHGQIKVEVSGGWVQGFEVPKGLFYFTLNKIGPTNENGKPEPREGQYGKWYILEFIVVGGEGGSQTPYEGLTFSKVGNYGIVVKDGVPDWEKNDQGNWTNAAAQMSAEMSLTAPALFEGDFSPQNPSNVLPEWEVEARRSKQILKGFRVEYTPKKGKNAGKTRIELEWSTVEPVYGFSVVESTKAPELPAAVVEGSTEDVKARDYLKTAMSYLAGEEAVTSDWKLTEAGKLVATEYLVPLKKKGVLPHAYLQRYTVEEVLKCLEALSESGDVRVKKIYASLAGLSLGFAGEDDDSPF